MPRHRSTAAVAGGSPNACVDTSDEPGAERGRWQPGLVNHHRSGEPAAGRATRLSARWRWVADFPATSRRHWRSRSLRIAAEAALLGSLDLSAEAAARPSRPESLLIAPPPNRPCHRGDPAETMRPPAPKCGGSGPTIAGAMFVRPAPKSLPMSARGPRGGPAAACSAAEAVERAPSSSSSPKARFCRGCWEFSASSPDPKALRRGSLDSLSPSSEHPRGDARQTFGGSCLRPLPGRAVAHPKRSVRLAGRVEDRLP
jgi:hypothetical protein